MPAVERQKGFVFLLVIVVIAIITALWISSKHENVISFFKNEQIDADISGLERVKSRLLQFAVLQPEVYMTEEPSGDERDASDISSPGYFPCPDLNGDGILDNGAGYDETKCGGVDSVYVGGDATTGFVPMPNRDEGIGACNGSGVCVGYVPEEISTRNVYFGEKGRYFYFLDERFAFANPNYASPNFANRFAPLFPGCLEPSADDALCPSDQYTPRLTLNGQGGYVAVIIYPGKDGALDAVNNDGDSVFESNKSSLASSDNLDKAVGITYNQWLWAVGQRICKEYGRLRNVDVNREHWFNDYRDSSSTYVDPVSGATIANPNIGGSSWRSWGMVCQ
ncbi:MAG: hypothetical protein IE914_10310 [Thiotrichales bacterium]|nr:hypothetical protein [Thiotrichales bacterium]